MNYQHTTQVPNQVLDNFLPILTGAEFKILMVIIRQTYGWRKERDRMNYTQLIQKTGLSRRVIADSIQSLINKNLIIVTDYHKNTLHTPQLRKGKTSIYFSSSCYTNAENNTKVGTFKQKDVQEVLHNKTHTTKLSRKHSLHQGTKRLSDLERLREIFEEKRIKNDA